MKKILKVIILSLVLSLPQTLFAETLGEAKFMGRLWSHTQDQQYAGDLNYLKAALGEEQFEGKFTGISDTSPYVRAESAEIIYEFASEKTLPSPAQRLLSEANDERDSSAREAMYFYAKKAEFKYADERGKEKVVLDFLNKCSQTGAFNADKIPEVPLRALSVMIEEAEDRGMQAAVGPLRNLKNTIFKDSTGLKQRVDTALTIISWFQGKNLKDLIQLKSIYTTALRQKNDVFQNWAIHRLTKENTPTNQLLSNQILLELLLPERGVYLNRARNTQILKEAMEQSGILRKENLTPANEVTFTGKLPKKIEFGLSYKISSPEDTGGEEQVESNITLKALITLKNLQSGRVRAVEQNLSTKDTSYPFRQDTLYGRFEAPAGSLIQCVKLQTLMEGGIGIQAEGIFVRRSEEEFFNNAPEISSLSVANRAVLSGEWVTLRVVVRDPEGNRVTGQWASNLEGQLGSAGINISAKLTQEGEHTLFFTAKDEFGLESMAVTEINVLKPKLSLSADTPAGGLTSISGNIIFHLNIEGLGAYANSFIFDSCLYANAGNVILGKFTASDYTLDTFCLPDGFNKIFVKANVRRPGSGAIATYNSATLLLYVNNTENSLAPRIVSIASDPRNPKLPVISEPMDQMRISRATDFALAFDNPNAKPTACIYVLSNAQGRVYGKFSAASQKPYKITLNPANYPAGSYTLVAQAVYTGAKRLTAESEPISLVIIKTRP